MTYIVSSHKQPDTVRTTVVTLSANLHLEPQDVDHPADRVVASIRVLIVDAFLTHVAAARRTLLAERRHLVGSKLTTRF